jgi:hypothetical protein
MKLTKKYPWGQWIRQTAYAPDGRPVGEFSRHKAAGWNGGTAIYNFMPNALGRERGLKERMSRRWKAMTENP